VGETEIKIVTNTTDTIEGEIATEFIGDLFGKVQSQVQNNE